MIEIRRLALAGKLFAVHGEWKSINIDNKNSAQGGFMHFNKTIFALCLGATIFSAQATSISGTVKDRAGVGIPDATVKLEVANISTTTGSDGSFTLTENPTVIQSQGNSISKQISPIRFQGNRLEIFLSENTIVTINVHDVSGRRLFSSRKIYGAGAHTFPFTSLAGGVHLYIITIGQNTYSYKSSPFGTFSNESKAEKKSTPSLAKQARAFSEISDVLSVIKEGQLNYRDSIKVSDTSGIVVTMIPNAGNVTDADGNVYQSVQIGNQVWTVENLRTTKYNDNTSIAANVTDKNAWYNLTTGAYCYYENSSANGTKYGSLYNWYAVNTGKLAPEGWRVPTDAEWDTLQNYLIANGYNWGSTTSGNKIGKSLAAQTDWYSSSTSGNVGNGPSSNNRTGFSALPGGCRYGDGYFGYFGYSGDWWSATEFDASRAWYRLLGCYHEALCRYGGRKSWGFSVRLLRD